MFNLRKYSATTDDGSVLPNQVSQIVEDSLSATQEKARTNKADPSDQSSADATEGLNNQQAALVEQSKQQLLMTEFDKIIKEFALQDKANKIIPPDIWNRVQKLPSYQQLMAKTSEDLAKNIANAFPQGGGPPNRLPSDYDVYLKDVRSMLQQQLNMEKQTKNQPGGVPSVPAAGAMAFNLQRYIQAQAQPQLASDRFPVSSVGDFIEKFLRDLMAWNGNHEERDAISARALEEIRDVVGQGFEEEANSALKTIQRMGSDNVESAAQVLAQIYEEWLSPMVKQESENKVMAEKIEGIVKYNLSDHVLNNKEATDGCIKTASANQSQEYTLYGPTEKRICPKLRGRNSIGGDVVSEYICRHHCNMGLVFDDNKTACGEAVWRANVMDKFSRDYVDEDGNVRGGYIEKRFEVNHNVPEENKMRLKPGEVRKPRPAEIFGNLEARMQAMRNKEGEDRGYRPVTDTSKPFNWTKDVDQNNVQVAQKERDRREEASGHETVTYTDKNDQENDPKPPKKAFNLSQFKQATNPSVEKTAELKESYNLNDTVLDAVKKGGFNLNAPPAELKGIAPDELGRVVAQLIAGGKAVRGPGQSVLPPHNQVINWPQSSSNSQTKTSSLLNDELAQANPSLVTPQRTAFNLKAFSSKKKR